MSKENNLGGKIQECGGDIGLSLNKNNSNNSKENILSKMYKNTGKNELTKNIEENNSSPEESGQIPDRY